MFVNVFLCKFKWNSVCFRDENVIFLVIMCDQVKILKGILHNLWPNSALIMSLRLQKSHCLIAFTKCLTEQCYCHLNWEITKIFLISQFFFNKCLLSFYNLEENQCLIGCNLNNLLFLPHFQITFDGIISCYPIHQWKVSRNYLYVILVELCLQIEYEIFNEVVIHFYFTMSGGPPHHPHNRQVPTTNPAWNHLPASLQVSFSLLTRSFCLPSPQRVFSYFYLIKLFVIK